MTDPHPDQRIEEAAREKAVDLAMLDMWEACDHRTKPAAETPCSECAKPILYRLWNAGSEPKLKRYFVYSPEYETGGYYEPPEYGCDVVDIEAESKRDALILAVAQQLKENKTWARMNREDGQPPWAGYKVEEVCGHACHYRPDDDGSCPDCCRGVEAPNAGKKAGAEEKNRQWRKCVFDGDHGCNHGPEDDPLLGGPKPDPAPPAPKGEDARVDPDEAAITRLWTACEHRGKPGAESACWSCSMGILYDFSAPLRKEIEELRRGYATTVSVKNRQVADLKAQVEALRETLEGMVAFADDGAVGAALLMGGLHGIAGTEASRAANADRIAKARAALQDKA